MNKLKSPAVIWLLALVLFMPAGAGQAVAAEEEQTKSGRQFAIVIDDFGNGMNGTDEMLQLPVKFTVAIMPFMPTTKKDAEEAHQLGHDVIVHMPMEPNKGQKTGWVRGQSRPTSATPRLRSG